MAVISTTILISNLHCSSCVSTIRDTLQALSPPPISISTSIVSQTVVIEHDPELSAKSIRLALDEAGFDLVSTPQLESYSIRRSQSYIADQLSKKRQNHTEQCLLCQQDTVSGKSSLNKDSIFLPAKDDNIPSRIDSFDLDAPKKDPGQQIQKEKQDGGEGFLSATFAVEGMTCASCVANITRATSVIPGVFEVAVNLMGHSATAKIKQKVLANAVIEAIEDAGYECKLVDITPMQQFQTRRLRDGALREQGPYRAVFSVGGMTCSSCTGNVTKELSELKGVSDVAVSLAGKSATATLTSKDLVTALIDAIEDAGYEAELISVEQLHQDRSSNVPGSRSVSLRMEGIYCQHCPRNIKAALDSFGDALTIDGPFPSHTDPRPVLRITYTPSPPELTIRHIVSKISSAKNPPFKVIIEKPPSLEERARILHAHEQRLLLIRLVSAVIIAIPTFIIGIVFMSLVPKSNATRMWFMQPLWAGNASRVQWVLLVLATPAMFFSAWPFHRRSIKEIYVLWRPGSKTPIWRRFVRFGSMNLLISLGVSVAYFASIALLILAAARNPDEHGEGDDKTYFDSVVFLTMFLLAGRYLEAYSKGRTTDAVSALGRLRPTEALLLVPVDEAPFIPVSNNLSDIERGSVQDTDMARERMSLQKVNVDLLEVGDVVRVPHGGTPPADGIIISKEGGQFNESSLTGESRPIRKGKGDEVFVGTINRGKAVDVKVTALGGETMLDQIVKVVREGQTKRAPIEKAADVLTGHFVPVITLLAILTFVIWLSLGLSGALPRSYLDTEVGGWSLWALEFAIAVFVIACPCGIGLAAPTALLVGSGLAAKFGILVRGGGEAFQEAAQLDVVVFDKTGTLTEGGEPQVTDTDFTTEDLVYSHDDILDTAYVLESTSSHPLATAIRRYCESRSDIKLFSNAAETIEETAGRGLKGSFSARQCDAIIGNESWMEEHGANFSVLQERLLQQWQQEGKSVIALAMRPGEANVFRIVAIFAAADKLRAESQGVVKSLQDQGLGTWMISGDNPTTAKAVAKTVGIPEEYVIAGVLPHQKAEKIKWLQRVGMKRRTAAWRNVMGIKRLNERCIVAMVGDGINDAPALTAADVGIAIGSGSDVAISSASFILIKSDLQGILILTDLSRKVFRRVKFNFLWAGIYNLIALPVAAGVLYPAGHTRLDPVWASLAMALSSVSVVVSSLMLRLYRQPRWSGPGRRSE